MTAELAGQGRLEIERYATSDATGAGGKIRNWFRDPYDPEYSGLRSISDDEQYDALVPITPCQDSEGR